MDPHKEQVLVVEYDDETRKAIVEVLKREGFSVDEAGSRDAAAERLRREACTVLIAGNGLDLIEDTLVRHPDTVCILIAESGALETAVQAVQKGAFGYLTRPPAPGEAPILVRRALEQRDLRRENRNLRSQLQNRYASSNIALGYAPEIDIPEDGVDFQNVVTDLERELILQSLRRTNGNKSLAAQLLNLKRTTLVEKIKRLGLTEHTSRKREG